MPMDPYSICPCGSGKKLKFCCQALSHEMEKVEKLIDNHQPRMALQTLDKLAKTNEFNPWVITRQAASLLSDGRAQDSKTVLLNFLRHKPDHPSANALYAMAMVQQDGLPEARKAIQRAFRFSIAAEPMLVSGLAQYLGEYHWQHNQIMAARQHLVMALQLGNELQHKEFVESLMELDSDSSVPFSFRGGHEIPPYQAPDAAVDQVARAQRFASVGCWGDAATLLADVAAQHDPSNANLWYLIGLYRAWNGDEELAAQALHRSAEMIENDFDRAVEIETLAQELERNVDGNCTNLLSVIFHTDQLSRVLSILDDSPLAVKIPQQESYSDNDLPTDAVYAILNRPSTATTENATLDDLSKIIGRVSAYDAESEPPRSAQIHATGLEGGRLDQTIATLKAAVGDLITPSDQAPPEGIVVGVERPDDEPLTYDYYVPRPIAAWKRRLIRREFITRCTQDGWKNHPLLALGGKTPREVANDPAMRVKLAAAIECLDAVADDMGWIIPIEKMRAELGLPAPVLIRLENDSDLKQLTLFQIRRIDVAQLAGDPLRAVIHRTSLAKLGRLSSQLMAKWVEGAADFQDEDQKLAILRSLCELTMRSLNDVEARKWNAQAQEIVQSRPNAFEKIIEWKIGELQLRTSDPDHGLSLFRELWDVFGAKIPRLRMLLEKLADQMGYEHPLNGIITATAGMGSTWSPDTPTAAPATQKLWLPEND